MDYLQYLDRDDLVYQRKRIEVLNLIINGLPSIHNYNLNERGKYAEEGFKPYYKWITFNT